MDKHCATNELLSALLTAGLSGLFAVLGVGVTLWFENKRNALAHKRWYVDHYIVDKLQSLRKLHVALVDCHFTLNFYGNVPPQTLVEFKENVSPKEDVYLQAMVMASLYLNQSEKKVFSASLSAFRQAKMAIWLSLPNGQLPDGVVRESYGPRATNIEWERFTATYENSIKLLEEKLHPESLKKLESNLPS